MSHSTCLLENTRPTPNPDTSHSTSTRNQTIHLALSKTFRNPSTNGCPTSALMNIRLTKRHSFIRKLYLDDSGYNHRLTFTPHITQSPNSTRKNRHRNIIWYNPPFSKNVATNVGRTFLKILNEEFLENYVFLKIFNRNTVKISYSCMPSLKQKISGHNKSIPQTTTTPPGLRTCNCRIPADCPVAGSCLTSSVVYQATVTTDDNMPAQTDDGLTETPFKIRFANHKPSLNNPNTRLSTELSKHVWCFEGSRVPFKITWKFLKQTSPYNPVSGRCNLCLWEKYFIICKPELATLNKQNELATSCRHANKFLLRNFHPTITVR